MPAVLKYVMASPEMPRGRSCSAEIPVMPAVFQCVAARPERSRDRSRSAEVPLMPGVFKSAAASPAISRQSSRSALVPVMPGVFNSVAASPAISRESSRSAVVPVNGISPQRACSRERSRSVEVPVEVVSPQRTPPQTQLCYVPPPVYNSPEQSLWNTEGLAESVGTEKEIVNTVPQHSCSLQRSACVNTPDAGPKVEVKPKPQEKMHAGSKKCFLDASSRGSPVIVARTDMLASSTKDFTQWKAAWSTEDLSAGTVKLRWQAGMFSVIDKQAKNECPEAAPEPLVRYFDGLLEVESGDLSALRDVLASDLAVGIGDQPGTGMTGAVVIAGPEFFHITETHASAVLDSPNLCQTFSFPVLVRHQGSPCEASAAECDKAKEMTSLCPVMSGGPQWVDPSHYLYDADIQQDKADAKMGAAELKDVLSQHGNEVHKGAVVVEKERIRGKVNAEVAKTKEVLALANAVVAHQQVAEAEEKCDAAHRRAVAAETERDQEKEKWKMAKLEVVEANAKLLTVEIKAAKAEEERDAAKAQIIAAEKDFDTEKASIQMSIQMKEEACKAALALAMATERECAEEKMKAEVAKSKEEETLAEAKAAEQKAVEAEVERDAAHRRAIAAEIECDKEKEKLEAAKLMVAKANAKVRAAKLLVVQAEDERDVAKAQRIAVERDRDEKLINQITEEERNADRERAIVAENERLKEQLKAEEALAMARAAQKKALEAEVERDEARRWAMAAETERDEEKAKLEAAKVQMAEADAKIRAVEQKVAQEDISAVAQKGSKSTDMEFPVHLQAEAAFAHAYLPVDDYINLLMSEISYSKRAASTQQQLVA